MIYPINSLAVANQSLIGNEGSHQAASAIYSSAQLGLSQFPVRTQFTAEETAPIQCLSTPVQELATYPESTATVGATTLRRTHGLQFEEDHDYTTALDQLSADDERFIHCPESECQARFHGSGKLRSVTK